ncbi:MAG: hypothetical protein KA354_19475 [Phycisphaerae bacterium]|nr:hypothetical protein [Phycisphaerae bacterium]
MDYEIARGSGRCTATARELAEGEVYYAVLFETNEGFERRDFASDAWTGPPEGHFCYWRAKVPPRHRKPSTVVVDHALLTSFFCRLEDHKSELRQQFRFVLALLLMRKRILKLDGTVREGDRESWRLRLVADQSEHLVLNPRLSDEQIERLSAQLTAILSGDAMMIESLVNEEELGPADSNGALPVVAGEGSVPGPKAAAGGADRPDEPATSLDAETDVAPESEDPVART